MVTIRDRRPAPKLTFVETCDAVCELLPKLKQHRRDLVLRAHSAVWAKFRSVRHLPRFDLELLYELAGPMGLLLADAERNYEEQMGR